MEYSKQPFTLALAADASVSVELHWQERGSDGELMPDWNMFLALERAGTLRTFVVKNDEGGIVGYNILNVGPDPHQITRKIARELLLFLQRDYRSPQTSRKLITVVDDMLAQEGVKVVQRAAPNVVYERWLATNGYASCERWLSKHLEATA